MNAKGPSVSETSGLYCTDSQTIHVDYETAFCRLITERTGIVLQNHQLANLHATLIKACKQFSYKDYAQLLLALQASRNLSPQLDFLICGITVGESYFFRDSPQMELLRFQLLPEIIARKRAWSDFNLRIWSSGCSQGQEIYTMAIMLIELLPDIENWKLNLLGTDINNELLAKAMQGFYSEWSFRALPPGLRQQWFSPKDSGYEIHSKIRNMVSFNYHNLNSAHYASICEGRYAMDIILCRNVFIYLDIAAIRHAMSQFCECLSERGILLLGASDPVEYQHTSLSWEQAGQTAYFKKSSTSITSLSVSEQDFQKPILQMPGDLAANTRQHTNTELLNLLAQADWQGVLEKVELACQNFGESSELWQIKAKALTSLGQIDLAQLACERSLHLNPVNKQAYFLQAMVLAEQGLDSEAEATLRKALYLDHSFIEAHYEMALLKIRTQRLPLAIKSLENALKLALQADQDSQLLNRPGTTYREFAKTLSTEIARLREDTSTKN